MSLKTFNPTTPSNRHRSITIRSNLWKGNSINKLTVGLSKKSGHNNSGHITVFTKGGGHNHNYRKIDFKRTLINIPALNIIDKCYLKGQIVNINKNLINLDVGLKSYVKISKPETLNSFVNPQNINIGNYVKFFFYKVETIMGDSIIDSKSLKYKIKKKEYRKYRRYKLPILLYNKLIRRYSVKGILLRKKQRKKRILIGIGGMISLLLKK